MTKGDQREGNSGSGRLLWGVLTILLALHAIVVHLNPSYLGLYRARDMYRGQGGPGIFKSPAHSMRNRIETRDGRQYLWAGSSLDDHFDVTEFRLNESQLHYGLGRERFPALIEPSFVSVSKAESWFDGADRVLLVRVEDDTRVYPLRLLQRHEVVNDVVGGRPIFAAYCVLADLGAIYDRNLEGHTFTFAVSGYTYSDRNVWDGMDAFVLWDRDTESLWWPPIGKAVSGPMIDRSLLVFEEQLWSQTTWKDVTENFPDALVLEGEQDFARPASWPPYDQGAGGRPDVASESGPNAIPPRWGANQGI